ncbi:MAG: FAD-dependent oxidoreductase [Chloroflexota bacterium]
MASDCQIETDVLVVGGGLAGVLAAIKACEDGASVILADKGYVGKSGGAAFGAVDLGVFNPEWGHDKKTYMDFIVKVGEYINNRDWIEIVLKESYARYQDMASWGVAHMVEEPKDATGEWMLHFKVPRGSSYAVQLIDQSHPDPLGSWRQYMVVLRKQAEKAGVKIMDRIMLVDLLKQDGRVVGAAGFHAVDGDFYVIKAKATIVATGTGHFKAPGQPMSYWTADGEAMSYRAGAEITGKEFGSKDNGRVNNEPTRRKIPFWLNRTTNALGEEVPTKYSPGFYAFDRRSLSLYFEVHEGRAPLFIDKTENPEDGKLEWIVGHGTGWVRATAGVVINTKCESGLPGLYAAGICAGTHFMGSCYAPTGYGLMVPAVTGYRAGENATSFAKSSGKLEVNEKEISRLKAAIMGPLQRNSGFTAGWVTQMVQNLMLPYYISQVKHGERLQAALTLLKFIEGHLCPQIQARDAHELRMAHEVRNIAQNAEMMLTSSLFRAESRGGHFREDYPHRVDPDWLAWTVLKNDGGEMTPYKVPVPEKWWPDLSLPYEQRYEFKLLGEA